MSQIARILAVPIQIQMPVLVVGEPGVGKTATLYGIARALGWHLEVVIASIREPSDFAGFPSFKDVKVGESTMRGTTLAAPDWSLRCLDTSGTCTSPHCPFFGQKHPVAGPIIILFNEISTAAPAVQAAFLRPVVAVVVGEIALPRACSRVAAANPAEMAAGGWDLTAPLANRFIHLPWKSEVDEWIEGSLTGWPEPNIPTVPENWMEQYPDAITKVVSFIRAKQQLLQVVPDDETKKGQAWPSRRTWTMAARILAACRAAHVDEGIMIPLIAGCVGVGSGHEFVNWLKHLNLPNPEDLIKNPESFKLPPTGDQQFTILASVATYTAGKVGQDGLSNKEKEKVWKAAWKIMGMAAQQNAKDIAAAAAKTLANLKAQHMWLPLPKEDIKEFVPLMRQAGMLD